MSAQQDFENAKQVSFSSRIAFVLYKILPLPSYLEFIASTSLLKYFQDWKLYYQLVVDLTYLRLSSEF